MDFSITPEQQALYDSMKRLAADVLAPGAAERDKTGTWDAAIWQKLAANGVAGMPIPEEYGGSGGSIIDCCLANEALSEGGHDGGFGLSLGAHWVIGAVPIWLHGSEELKRRWLPGLCDGTYMGAWASTEPEAGSDAGSFRTTATRDGDDYLLNGTKIFITNGPIADVCNVLARTDKGPTAFCVDTKTPGFVVGRELDKMGCRSSPTAEIHLQDCRVPASSILSVEGEALWRVAFECFDWERTVMIAGAVGGMRATIDATVQYAKQREQFGKPIAHFQAIAHKIAQMEMNYHACRNAVYKAAWLKQEGKEHQLEASMAKAMTGELSVQNALEAIQIHGGYGYLRDFPAERALRDAKLGSIGGGTTEIQKMIISRLVLG
ncbi:MAG: acyl-CoA dehydrogenase family protein [Actinobacteria bacterium]|nr:acyl-CoA dehydrogenase family protein [Actinomycetota bacterium]MCA1720533.1 acyl-CoA dehydrogenase family protein [Actinomycetota bacterium]